MTSQHDRIYCTVILLPPRSSRAYNPFDYVVLTFTSVWTVTAGKFFDERPSDSGWNAEKLFCDVLVRIVTKARAARGNKITARAQCSKAKHCCNRVLKCDVIIFQTFKSHHEIYTAAVRTCAKFQIASINESEVKEDWSFTQSHTNLSYLASVPNFTEEQALNKRVQYEAIWTSKTHISAV